MPRSAQHPTGRIASLRAIAQILDYALGEGAQLGLPVLVNVLRMALMELDLVIARERRAASRVIER
jgi:hypothetical protein